MGLSAKSLFHFTKFEYLKNILIKGFYPRCSIEQVAIDIFPVAIPMVSFCDIRITQLQDHIETYNGYGIGLTKEWGIRNKMNPLFYLEEGTFPYNLIKNLVTSYLNSENLIFSKDDIAINLNKDAIKSLNDLLHLIIYCKFNNSQRWNKTDKMFDGSKINFYDEREWRYFPGVGLKPKPGFLPLPFIPYIKSNNYNAEVAINRRDLDNATKALMFDQKDIKYLIVENELEIDELITFIKENNLFHDAFNQLINKITTVERILDDH